MQYQMLKRSAINYDKLHIEHLEVSANNKLFVPNVNVSLLTAACTVGSEIYYITSRFFHLWRRTW